MLRATLLLPLLVALAPAAPAPFPRERRDPDARTWSKPVDGLRVRFVALRTNYRVGETVRLMLEIQNVSDAPLTTFPNLNRSVSNPGAAPSGWAITCERTVAYERLTQAAKEIEELTRLCEPVRLPAGAILRIEIRANSGKLAERNVQLLEEGEPRRENLYFSAADTPGVYELRATFRREPRKRDYTHKLAWSGKALMSPPVKIELHE
jgi:hypothetical protein